MSAVLGALLLGALQGATEFLPISSSGHLVLLQHFVSVEGDSLAFDLVLHMGTLVPVLVLFRDDLLRMVTDPLRGEGPMMERPGARWLLYVVVATIPTVIMGLLLEDLFESMFSGFSSLAWQFALTAGVLQMTAKHNHGTTDIDGMTVWHALVIGVAQGVSILPAVSRSGSTIAAALFLGLRRDVAGRFSFVLSVPAILGAMVLKARHVTVDPAVLPIWLMGAAAALVVGWGSLLLLMRVVRAGDFSKFAWYCWGMAVVCGLLGFFAA